MGSGGEPGEGEPKVPAQQATGKYALEPWKLQSEDDAAAAMKHVAAGAQKWHDTTPEQRIELLRDIRKRAIKASLELGRRNAKTTGFVDESGKPDMTAKGSSFALLLGMLAGRICSAFIAMLQQGTPEDTPCARVTADGAKVFQTWPSGDKKDALFGHLQADMYTQPGKPGTRGKEFAQEHAQPAKGAALVLGAGNFAILGLWDSLHKLFMCNEPVLLKHHDAQSLNGEVMEYMLQPLRTLGVFQGVRANVTLTMALLRRPELASVHLTGGYETHEHIVWGPKAGRAARKASNDPVLKVPMTSELGNVTPVLASPGAWSEADMKRMADHVATSMLSNAGCNCLAPKLLVLPEEWHLADAFIAAVKTALRNALPEPAWYPNAEATWNSFCSDHENVSKVEQTGGSTARGAPVLPYAFSEVTLDSVADAAGIKGIQAEYFAPCFTIAKLRLSQHVTAEQRDVLSAMSADDAELTEMERSALDALRLVFLRQAVTLVNEHAFGDLVAMLLTDKFVGGEKPAAERAAVDALKYGSIVVNGNSFAPAAAFKGMWGGWQGEGKTLANVGSGLGVVINVGRYDDAQKAAAWQSFDFVSPMKEGPMSQFFAKGMAGFLVDGVVGVWQAAMP